MSRVGGWGCPSLLMSVWTCGFVVRSSWEQRRHPPQGYRSLITGSFYTGTHAKSPAAPEEWVVNPSKPIRVCLLQLHRVHGLMCHHQAPVRLQSKWSSQIIIQKSCFLGYPSNLLRGTCSEWGINSILCNPKGFSPLNLSSAVQKSPAKIVKNVLINSEHLFNKWN